MDFIFAPWFQYNKYIHDNECSALPSDAKEMTHYGEKVKLHINISWQCYLYTAPGWLVAVLPGNGPLARYVKLRVAHAPGMPETFSPPPRVSDPDMLAGTCVPWCVPGSITSGLIWSRWRRNVPGIPGTCATRNFRYMIRGPWQVRIENPWLPTLVVTRKCLNNPGHRLMVIMYNAILL